MTATIISILNMKGGVGKTTLTTNISVELFNRNKRVLVIDVDPQFNSTQTLMKFFEKKLDTYFDLRDKDKTLARVFKSTNQSRGIGNFKTVATKDSESSIIHTVGSNSLGGVLDIIPGDMGLIVDITDAASDKFRSFIKKNHLKDNYDYILIDCPPTWGQLTSVALSTSDYYLIPTNLDEFSTIGITLLAELLSDKVNSVDKPLKNLGVVYMFLKQNTAEDGIARDQKRFRNDIEEYFTDMMEELVASKVRPFDTVFYSDNYLITKSALYFDEAIEKHRPDYKQKVCDLVDEIQNRLSEGSSKE
ncbi:AAA family ATPase [Limosilactobacillus fermentum]